MVYSDGGAPFGLDTTIPARASLGAGVASYNLTWFDAVSGVATAGGRVDVAAAERLTPPTRGAHWVAVIVA